MSGKINIKDITTGSRRLFGEFKRQQINMGYSEDDSIVRVDFFKSSGKWYTTEAVKWTGEWKNEDHLIHEEFAKSLRDALGNRLKDMDAICLEPYYECPFPIQIKHGGWTTYDYHKEKYV
jgi:hypothetical protein